MPIYVLRLLYRDNCCMYEPPTTAGKLPCKPKLNVNKPNAAVSTLTNGTLNECKAKSITAKGLTIFEKNCKLYYLS